MTVSSSISSVSYSGNGSTTVFSYTFKIFADSDLVVSLRDNATGASTTQTLTTDYTVSNAGSVSGGNVTFVTSPASGKTVIIRRVLPYTQETDYVENDPFPAEAHENALDKLTMLTQQNRDEDAIKLPEGDVTSGINNVVPNAVDRANTVLAFDGTGNVVVQPLSSTATNSTITQQAFTGNGSTTAFTLSAAPGAAGVGVSIYIDGVYQERNTYSISNTALTFTEAPPTNSSIEVLNYRVADIGTADANNVTYTPAGTGAVQTTVQTKLRESVSVKDFGAVGDGVTDDTAAIQAALTYVVSVKGTMFVPKGIYVISGMLDITDRCAILGEGAELTIFKVASSYSDFVIRLNDTWRNNNGEDTTTTTSIVAGSGKAGVQLKGFTILGDRANTAKGIVFYKRNDTAILEDIKLKYLNGSSLNIGNNDDFGLVRESLFFNVVSFGCGNATEPAVVISTGATVLDGTNNLEFHKLNIQHPFGVGLQIMNNKTATYATRRISFYGFMCHGQNLTDASAPAKDLIKIVGFVEDIDIIGLNGNGSNDDTTNKFGVVRIEDDASGNSPAFIKIHGDIRSCKGHAYIIDNVEFCDISGTVAASGAGQSIIGNELLMSASSLTNANFNYHVIAPATRSISIDSSIAKFVSGNNFVKTELPLRFVSGAVKLGVTGTNDPELHFGGASSPESTVTAPKGSLYVRNNQDSSRSSNSLYVKATAGTGNTGWKKVINVTTATTAQLTDVGDTVNTQDPQTGQMVYNTTTNKPCWKGGSAAGSVWRNADGTVAHTPV